MATAGAILAIIYWAISILWLLMSTVDTTCGTMLVSGPQTTFGMYFVLGWRGYGLALLAFYMFPSIKPILLFVLHALFALCGYPLPPFIEHALGAASTAATVATGTAEALAKTAVAEIKQVAGPTIAEIEALIEKRHKDLAATLTQAIAALQPKPIAAPPAPVQAPKPAETIVVANTTPGASA